MSHAIPILLYHHINPHAGDTVTVTPDIFAEQLRFLAASGYHTLSVGELLAAMRGTIPLDEKSLVITFDDGWRDNFLFAYPALLKYRFNAATFLITARVDAAQAYHATADVPVHVEAKRLIAAGEAGKVVLDWETIRSVLKQGFMEYYSHSVSHRRASSLSPADLVSELTSSKQLLEERLDRKCPYFCWPYGDFNDAAVQLAKDAGYSAMFTTITGFTTSGDDPFRIKRIEVENSVDWLRQRLSAEILECS